MGLDGLKVPGMGLSRDGIWPQKKVVLQGRLEHNLLCSRGKSSEQLNFLNHAGNWISIF